jgi:hypothetical protein
MAIRYAVATGNWNAVATWDGGATLPTAGDIVYSNTFVVTINQNIIVDKISNNVCPTTGLSGGSFALTSSRTLLCEIESYNSTCLNASGVISVITGKLISINQRAIYFFVNASGIATLNVLGDCVMGNSANCIEIEGNGGGRQININITGNGTSTASKKIIHNSGNITFLNSNVTGNFNSGGAVCFDTPNTSFVGVGSFKASATASVIVGAATCLANISGTLENVNSRMAVVFNSMYLSPTTSLVWKFYDSDDEEKSLYTSDAFDSPDESDVRDGVVYGAGSLTGTLEVEEFLALPIALKERLERVATTEEVGTIWAD